jgi:hypothetical protein
MRGALVLVALLVGVAAAAPVAAKEGVVAKVRVPVSRAAEAGTEATMVWELTAVESGRAQPFDADGIFLRHSSAPRDRGLRVRMQNGSTRVATAQPRGCLAAVCGAS